MGDGDIVVGGIEEGTEGRLDCWTGSIFMFCPNSIGLMQRDSPAIFLRFKLPESTVVTICILSLMFVLKAGFTGE